MDVWGGHSNLNCFILLHVLDIKLNLTKGMQMPIQSTKMLQNNVMEHINKFYYKDNSKKENHQQWFNT